MEERNTYDNQYEIVISFNKIWDNISRYWWIVLICFILSILAAFGVTYRSYSGGKASLQSEYDYYMEEREKIENSEEELEYIYVAKSVVYMAREIPDLNTLMKDSVLPDVNYLEERGDYIELYKEYMSAWLESTYISLDKTLLYDCLALIGTDSVFDEINKQLLSNGYEKLDEYSEKINMHLGNNARFYTLTIDGDDPERLELILNIATDILIEKSRDVLGIEYCKIVDEASAKRYMIWEDVRYPATEQAVDAMIEILNDRLEENLGKYDTLAERLEDYHYSLRNVLSKKGILVVFVGIFMGLGIVFIMVLLDKKVRNKDEIAMYFNYPVLGDVNEKSEGDEQYSVIAAALNYKCSKQGITSLLITGSENADKTKVFSEKLADELRKIGKSCSLIEITSSDLNVESKIESAKRKEGILIVNAGNVNKSPAAIQAAGNVDSIIYAISANNEDISFIQKGMNNIKLVGGTILGCILIKNSKTFK